MSKIKTDKEIEKDKQQKLLDTVSWMCSYFRANPSRFIEMWIPSIKLKPFQKIILWAMAHNDMAYFVASRGLGKTYILAMYGLFKCICYPGTHMVCVSHTFKQGREIILKITDDIMLKSPLVRNEIDSCSTGQNDCAIRFKNSSWMRVAVAGESSRGIRSTVLCVDESRLVDQKTVDTILRPMNSSPRAAGYLNKEEYKDLKEVPQEFYLSSAYYCQSEMFEKVKAYTANMLTDGLKYFVCDLPYQLSIKDGILLRQTIENEMSEATFSDITFSMEREGLFYGASDDALFDFKTLESRRVITNALFGLDYYRVHKKQIPEKQRDEIRVLSVDVALLASKKHDNDASSIMIHSGKLTSTNDYVDNVVFVDSAEGLTTEELGLLVMRDFYQYDCDFIGLDCTGIGQAVLDYLMSDRYDPVCSQTYGALNVYNAPDLAERCKVKNAPKVVFSLKANSKSNNDMTLALRAGLQNGYINLLVSEYVGDTYINSIRGTGKMTDEEKVYMRMPYLQTTFLINELVNLTYDSSGGFIKVKEKYGMRKDRYSSLMYGYYVLQELSKRRKPQNEESNELLNKLKGCMRASSILNR